MYVCLWPWTAVFNYSKSVWRCNEYIDYGSAHASLHAFYKSRGQVRIKHTKKYTVSLPVHSHCHTISSNPFPTAILPKVLSAHCFEKLGFVYSLPSIRCRQCSTLWHCLDKPGSIIGFVTLLVEGNTGHVIQCNSNNIIALLVTLLVEGNTGYPVLASTTKRLATAYKLTAPATNSLCSMFGLNITANSH